MYVKNNNVDYGQVRKMMEFLNNEPTTILEYRDWVRAWRVEHEHLVSDIIQMRNYKNDVKFGTGLGSVEMDIETRETLMNRFINVKRTLRPYARAFYEKRVEYKENFKNGVYGDPTQRFIEA